MTYGKILWWLQQKIFFLLQLIGILCTILILSISVLFYPWIPESPRFLITKKDYKKYVFLCSSQEYFKMLFCTSMKQKWLNSQWYSIRYRDITNYQFSKIWHYQKSSNKTLKNVTTSFFVCFSAAKVIAGIRSMNRDSEIENLEENITKEFIVYW